jgi:hypothetical protein
VGDPFIVIRLGKKREVRPRSLGSRVRLVLRWFGQVRAPRSRWVWLCTTAFLQSRAKKKNDGKEDKTIYTSEETGLKCL